MLTDKQIKFLEPKEDAYYETDDTSRRGYGRLAVKVSPSGTKSFYLLYRFENKRRFLPLGNYPALTLQSARKLANDYGQMVFDGKDPRDAIQAEQQKAEEARAEERRKALEGSVGQLFEFFIKKTKIERSDQYYKAVLRVLSGEVLKTLGPETKASIVDPAHIAAALRPISSRGSLIMANRARSYLSAAFTFGLQFDHSAERQEADPLFNIKFNPVAPVPKSLKKENPSDRALNEEELRVFWQLIEKSSLSTERKILLKLLVVFGGRRVNEIIGAPWSEINLNEGLWDRPASRDKKGKHVLMPIGRMASELLTELYQHTGHQLFLFGTPPPTDYAINQTVRRLIKGKMDHFTPKSFRATAKTLMGKIGISKEARDRYHSHSLNDISSRHYDKFDYLDQKREVARKWEAFIADVIAGNQHHHGLHAIR